MILFACLAGRCPFQGDSLLALLNAITSKPVPRLCEVAPAMPQELDAVLFRAMTRPAPERFASVRAFGEALLPFASPTAQTQWAPFFAGAPAATLNLVRTSSVPAPRPDDLTAGALARGATLEPATRSSLGLGPRSGRKAAMLAGLGALAVALGIAGWASRRSPAPATTDPVTTVSAVQPMAVRARDEAPVVALPAVVDAGAPVTVLVRPYSRAEEMRSARPVRVLRPARRQPAAATVTSRTAHDCPNGICPPD